jgi:hypothetical protein
MASDIVRISTQAEWSAVHASRPDVIAWYRQAITPLTCRGHWAERAGEARLRERPAEWLPFWGRSLTTFPVGSSGLIRLTEGRSDRRGVTPQVWSDGCCARQSKTVESRAVGKARRVQPLRRETDGEARFVRYPR